MYFCLVWLMSGSEGWHAVEKWLLGMFLRSFKKWRRFYGRIQCRKDGSLFLCDADVWVLSECDVGRVCLFLHSFKKWWCFLWGWIHCRKEDTAYLFLFGAGVWLLRMLCGKKWFVFTFIQEVMFVCGLNALEKDAACLFLLTIGVWMWCGEGKTCYVCVCLSLSLVVTFVVVE